MPSALNPADDMLKTQLPGTTSLRMAPDELSSFVIATAVIVYCCFVVSLLGSCDVAG